MHFYANFYDYLFNDFNLSKKITCTIIRNSAWPAHTTCSAGGVIIDHPTAPINAALTRLCSHKQLTPTIKLCKNLDPPITAAPLHVRLGFAAAGSE